MAESIQSNKKRNLIIGIVVAIALVVIAIGVGLTTCSNTGKLSVQVNAEGWNKDTSTPIVLAIYEGDVKDILLSTDENAEVPTPINEISLNAGEDIKLEDVVDAGTYTLSIVGSPVLEDGTIFNVPEPQVVEYDGEKGQLITFELTVKAAEDVTEADIAAATAAANAVGADAGKVAQATNNTWNNASSAQGGSISQGQSNAQSKPSSGTSSSSGSSSNSGSSSSGNSGSTGSSGSSGSTGSSGGSTTAHTHSWNPHYAKVQTGSYILCSCGATFNSTSAQSAHAEEAYFATGEGHSWSRQYTYENVIDYYFCSCGATKSA